MTVCIVGHKGNMGRRYVAILNLLEVSWFGVEKEDNIDYCDTYILATPTASHVPLILRILETVNRNATILCEKPITTDITEFGRIPEEYWDEIYMVNQYNYLPHISRGKIYGPTMYDFYHSGNDGLAWDCIQLIYLAKNKTKIDLKRRSPVWFAAINGIKLKKSDMDQAYVNMVSDFTEQDFTNLWNLHRAYEAHKEVMNYLEANK
jgi:hypothetical protein